MTECTICLLNNIEDSVVIEPSGICDICIKIDKLQAEYGTGTQKGIKQLNLIVKKIKEKGKGKKYDCLIGVSGGTDSSYLVHLSKELGLKPLAFHYDNTWNSAIASMNIEKILSKLDIDLITYVVDNKEIDDLILSFFYAGVPELDASTDLAFAYLLRKTARLHGINYILEGHSFKEEGITALGKNYFDGRYIKDIHSKYGALPLKSYPLMTLRKFLYESIFGKVKFIRPLWYLEYDKNAAKKLLYEKYNWLDYGGHHLENGITKYLHSEYLPRKFNIDMRKNVLSARIRSKKITKYVATSEIKSSHNAALEAKEYFQKRLELNDETYTALIESTPKFWKQFKNYKKIFEILKPLFFILSKKNIVTDSFYIKYCIKAGK
jgi:hypothetical protein